MCNPNVLRRNDPRSIIAHHNHHDDETESPMGVRKKSDSSPDFGKTKKPAFSDAA